MSFLRKFKDDLYLSELHNIVTYFFSFFFFFFNCLSQNNKKKKDSTRNEPSRYNYPLWVLRSKKKVKKNEKKAVWLPFELVSFYPRHTQTQATNLPTEADICTTTHIHIQFLISGLFLSRLAKFFIQE